MFLSIFQWHAWLHHRSEIYASVLLLIARRLCKMGWAEFFHTFSHMGGIKFLREVQEILYLIATPQYCQFVTENFSMGSNDLLSARIPNQPSRTLSCRKVSRGRIFNHVCSLRIREELLSRHQPPHTCPTGVSSLNDFVAENVFNSSRMHTICCNYEIGLQNLASNNSDLAILGILVYTRVNSILTQIEFEALLSLLHSQSPWNALGRHRAVQGRPFGWQALSAGYEDLLDGQRTWIRCPCSS